MAKALYRYPHVARFVRAKASKCGSFLDEIAAIPCENWTDAEMARVTKNGGWLVICNGDDEFRRVKPDEALTSRGFEWFRHDTAEGGTVYNYRKRVAK